MSSKPPIDPLAADFRNFLFMVWRHLNLPNPTAIQYDIAQFLQHGPKRILIEAFRGVGKSWITSAFVLWVLYKDPQKKILVVSASKDRADAFVSFTRRLISDIPELNFLTPGKNQRDSTLLFEVGPAIASHAPSVKSLGITGQLAGNRADILIADDVETIKNSLTQMLRERLAQYTAEFDAILTPKKDSRIIYLGTPQSEMSIYNDLQERGFSTRIWPAQMPKAADLGKYGDALAPYIIKSGLKPMAPVDPDRFTLDELMVREASYGRSGYALQFMLNPHLSDTDKRPLKLSDLIIMDVDKQRAPSAISWGRSHSTSIDDLPCIGLMGDKYYGPLYTSPEHLPYTGTVMAVDPSGSGSDATGYAVVKLLNAMLFVVEAGGLPGGYSDDTLSDLAEIARRNAVNVVVCEANLGLGMFSSLLQPHLRRLDHHCKVEDVRHNVQKERRIIETLEPVMNQHRLVVDRTVVQNDYSSDVGADYKLFYQMSRLTMDKGCLGHDDALDALSMAVAYWSKELAVGNDAAAQVAKERALMNELRGFRKHVFGVKPPKTNFLTKV
jgi:hypothetical protein